jgi:hypothetical protein
MDMVFAILMFFFSAWTYVQTMIFPSSPPYGYTVALSHISIVAMVVFAFTEGYYGVPLQNYAGISLMTYCALVKATSTATKYSYQVYLNYKKKSTHGVVWHVLTADLIGSVLGIAVMQIDAVQGGYGFILNDPRMNFAKLLLCLFSGGFDAFILIQIFFIYPGTS